MIESNVKEIVKRTEKKEIRGGKKTRLTPEIVRELIRIVEAGHSRMTAVAALGLSEGCLYHWLKKGEERRNRLCIELYEGLKKAEARSKLEFLEVIKRAMPKSWQAAAWILERRWSDEFALRLKQDVKGDTKIVVRIDEELKDV